MSFLISAPPSVTSYKTPAKVASTASMALSGVIGSIQIDSITLSSLSTGDRILLKNQGVENGIYELTVSGPNYSLARSSDADTSAKLSPNSLVPVSQGTVNADIVFQLTNNSVNLGTDSLVFVAVDSAALVAIAAEQARAVAAEALALQKSSNLSDLASVGTAKTNLSLQNVDNTSDANKPVSTAQQTALNLKADLISPVFTTPNIGSATGSISGNAATVTTNANLTGPVTSVGNATAIANSAISNAMLANSAVANLSGTNTGDNAATSLVPSQTSQANKVLATDGSASSWQYAGLGSGGFGTNNVFLGMPKPAGLTSGIQNTVVAAGNTGNQLTTGSNNVLLGFQMYSGLPGLTGAVGIGVGGGLGANYQTVIGGSAQGNTTGGVSVGSAADHGSGDVAIGYNSASGAAASIAVGSSAKTGSGGSSIVIGSSTGKAACSGANNTVVGADCFNGAGLTTAHDNVIIGKGSGKSITSAFTNCLISTGAIALTTGDGNCIIGDMAASLATGQNNTAIGFKSTGGGLSSGASQYSSVAIGTRITCGSLSVAVGDAAVASGGTVTVGNSAGNGVTAGVCIGNSSGGYGASNITVVGTGAVARGSTGHGVSIGFGSGGPNANTDVGGYNTCIGTYTGNQLNNPSAASNVFLGYSAGRNNTTQGSTFFLDNQDRTTYAGQQTGSLMYGTFNAAAASQTLRLNAKVSSGNGTTTYVLSPFESDEGNSSTLIDLDLSLGASVKVTMTGNATFTFSNPTSGGAYLIKLVQDITGTRTVTWPAAVKWSGGVAPTLTTTATFIDIINLYYDGTNYYGSSVLNFAP